MTVNNSVGPTVVQVDSSDDLWRLLKWCERQGKKVKQCMYKQEDYPFFVTTASEVTGWSRSSPNYVPFDDFMNL